MPQTVLRVYLDEDVDVLLARLLDNRGFDCVTALEADHLAWDDQRHLEWATGEQRVTVTHNRVHFEKLATDWHHQGKDHAGVLLAVRRVSTYDLLRRVLPVLTRYDQTGWQDVVMYA